MFRLDSEEALLDSFRRRDRKSVQLSRDVTLPALVRDYLAWTHPAGVRVYLVFSIPGGVPTGIVFDSNGGAGPSVPQMCDWCHCCGLGSRVALLTAHVHSKKRVGVHVCSDLSCKQKPEDEANRSGGSALPAIEKLIARMGRFANAALNIDLCAAGR